MMEEEINYSTLVFNRKASAAEEKNEDQVVYSDVKIKQPTTTEPKKDEDQIVYSDVIIKAPSTTEPKKNEHQVIYSEVKIKEPTTTEPKATGDLTVHSTKKLAEPGTTEPKAEAVADSHSRIHLLLMCLGMICILLVASVIGIIVYITTVMNKQEANLNNLKGRNEQLIVEKRVLENETMQMMMKVKVLENQTEEMMMKVKVLENQTEQLVVEKRVLENQTEEMMVKVKVLENQTKLLSMEKTILKNQTEDLSRDRDDLNWTLGVILNFTKFPVNEFCKDKKCQPCRNGWVQYQKKCYLFYDKGSWKTWQQSRKSCLDEAADLVVIDNLQEQEFVMQNIKYYYDKHHGFWMGLKKTDNKWFWIDGREDTLRFWKRTNHKLYGLIIPGTDVKKSWDPGNDEFRNKFICEHDVLIRSN